MTRIVGLNGEPIRPAVDPAVERMQQLAGENAGLVNMLAVLVHRAGGSLTITEAELIEIDAFNFTAQNGEDGHCVVLSTVKVEPESPS